MHVRNIPHVDSNILRLWKVKRKKTIAACRLFLPLPHCRFPRCFLVGQDLSIGIRSPCVLDTHLNDVPELAESWGIFGEGRVYGRVYGRVDGFQRRKEVKFHD